MSKNVAIKAKTATRRSKVDGKSKKITAQKAPVTVKAEVKPRWLENLQGFFGRTATLKEVRTAEAAYVGVTLNDKSAPQNMRLLLPADGAVKKLDILLDPISSLFLSDIDDKVKRTLESLVRQKTEAYRLHPGYVGYLYLAEVASAEPGYRDFAPVAPEKATHLWVKRPWHDQSKLMGGKRPRELSLAEGLQVFDQSSMDAHDGTMYMLLDLTECAQTDERKEMISSAQEFWQDKMQTAGCVGDSFIMFAPNAVLVGA